MIAVASAPVDAKPTPPEVPQTESSTQGDSASSPVNDKEAESEKPSSTLAQVFMQKKLMLQKSALKLKNYMYFIFNSFIYAF